MLEFMPMHRVLLIVIQFAVVLFAISIHEAAHAWMADRCGDSTARFMGRVTLNPIAHIDPIGTVLFPIILALMGAPVFGWAKPVIVNPRNFKDSRRSHMLVAAAGPGANILAALVASGLFQLLRQFGMVSLYQGSMGVQSLSMVLIYLVLINLYLAVFNLIPIPPLDGSGILKSILKGEARAAYAGMEKYGFIILLALIWLGGLDIIARPIYRLVILLLS